jgi:tRNA A37 threonylcarbamoyladenosine synthetase subunit TsaC/SUA5/YrdC
MGYPCAANAHLGELTELSREIDDFANLEPNPRLPFVGSAAFAHKGGIHVQAVALDPTTYEHVEPGSVGNERRILVSELSGRNNVVERARELGLDLDADGDVARQVAAKIKELEREGFQFEDAEASFELLVRRAAGSLEAPFAAKAYSVDARKREGEEATQSVATAEVTVGGDVLRGEAVGGGPVDALEKALRRALTPAFPNLDNVSLTDFRSQIARGADGERGSVRVRLTGSAEGSRPWTTVGSAPDLLHASWLALVDCLEYAVLTEAGAPGPERPPAMPLAELAVLLQPDGDREALRAVEKTDWSAVTLDLADPGDRELAARATALGAALFYSFGNFCAIAAHPERRSVVRVNLVKGRPENQVGSVTTTHDRFETLFDWSLVPDGISRDQVLALMDAFYELGPMGFRGPAAHSIPAHLTSLDAELRTTQLIAPGYRCPSNELLDDVLARAGVNLLFITSANVSSGVTGKVEAAHYDLAGMQQDFGGADGIVLIGHRDEAAARAEYPRHLPMSTSILAFHKLADGALILERHGSLEADDVRSVVAEHGFELLLADGARERLPMRDAVPA